jgi:hypothetical protein
LDKTDDTMPNPTYSAADDDDEGGNNNRKKEVVTNWGRVQRKTLAQLFEATIANLQTTKLDDIDPIKALSPAFAKDQRY